MVTLLLEYWECSVVDDATPMPAIVKMEMPNSEPKSESIKFHNK